MHWGQANTANWRVSGGAAPAVWPAAASTSPCSSSGCRAPPWQLASFSFCQAAIHVPLNARLWVISSCCPAVAEVLRVIISTYREVFKAPNLTDAVLFSNYAVTVLVVDEVVREVSTMFASKPFPACGAGVGPTGWLCCCAGIGLGKHPRLQP